MANTIKEMHDLIARMARSITAIQPDQMARMSGPVAEELRGCLEASKVYTAMGPNGPRNYVTAPAEEPGSWGLADRLRKVDPGPPEEDSDGRR